MKWEEYSLIDPIEELVLLKKIKGGGSVLKTVTGTLLHILDALAKPAVSFEVGIEPQQDLHGQEAPYPSGGGKNKLPNNLEDGTVTESGITLKKENGVYTLSGTASATIRFNIPLASTVDLSPSTNKICFLNTASYGSVLVEFNRSGTRIHYWGLTSVNRVGSDWADTGNEVIDSLSIQVPSGTSFSTPLVISPVLMSTSLSDATSFSPYSNECPITGHTGANVVRTGKNLYPILSEEKTYTNGDITFTRNSDGSITFSGTATTRVDLDPLKFTYGTGTNTFSLTSGQYTISAIGITVSGVEYIYGGASNTSGLTYGSFNSGHTNPTKTVTLTNDGTTGYNILRVASGTVISSPITVKIQWERGSTATAYEPYTSTTIPITFPVLGKNLLDMSDDNIEVGKYIDNTGAEKTNGSNFYNSAYIPVNASASYTLSTSSSIKYCSFMEYDESKTFIKRTLYGNGSAAISTQSHTMGSTTAFVIIGSNPTGNTIDLSGIKAINWMFNEGSTAQAYEPYTTTAYGGTLTNNGADEWELIIEDVEVDLGTLSWTKINTTSPHWRFWAYLNDHKRSGRLISSQYKYVSPTEQYTGAEGISAQASGDNTLVMVSDERYEDAASFKTAMSGVQCVYEVATPTTYTLTSQQALTLLKGENNIWADGNGTLSLTYKAQA